MTREPLMMKLIRILTKYLMKSPKMGRKWSWKCLRLRSWRNQYEGKKKINHNKQIELKRQRNKNQSIITISTEAEKPSMKERRKSITIISTEAEEASMNERSKFNHNIGKARLIEKDKSIITDQLKSQDKKKIKHSVDKSRLFGERQSNLKKQE